jgi:3-oxoadipate enol-lactonase
MSLVARRCELVRPDTVIRYWVSGPRSGPRVVLLHGATLDHHAWDAQVRALRGRYRVVVPDLRGHGESVLDGPFRFEDALADVLALLDVLEAERPGSPTVIGGLSLGGNLAQEVVFRAPDRADALVVADSTCNTAARHPLAAPLAIASITAMGMASHEHFVQRAAEVTSPNEDVQRYVVAANEDRSTAETLQILTELLQGALHAEQGYQLPVPTLLLHGDGDRIGDIVDGTREWAAREELAEYVVIPAAGHASNQDNPEAFNAALLGFLDRVLSPRRGWRAWGRAS